MGTFFSKEYEFPITKRTSYGWIPDIPDSRDKYEIFKYKTLEPQIYLKDFPTPPETPIEDTHKITAFMVCIAFEYEKKGEANYNFEFLHKNAASITNTNIGTSIRDTLKTLNKIGVTILSSNDENMYKDAQQNKCFKYTRINNYIKELKYSLMLGHPIICGYSENDFSSVALIIGYDNKQFNVLTDKKIIQKSYKEISKQFGDFWIIKEVEKPFEYLHLEPNYEIRI